ncbi:16S rRNA (guanine(527)-N(7))-methyltransferase RsmG [Bacillaceae bacterium S4-13-56]
MTPEQFKSLLLAQGIDLNDQQMKQFELYFNLLVEWNEKMNLTALTEQSEVYLKHFYDSITASFYFDFHSVSSLCDVGAGAGFPSIPLKICFPHLKVTIVDSLNKRITFLNYLASQLGLKDVAFYHDRAESFGKNLQLREKYDVVTARAVARLSVLNELCLPLVKVGGHFVVMKGSQFREELKEGDFAMKLLGGELTEDYEFELPNEGGERNIGIIKKNKKSPNKYPRKPGVPGKTPLLP